MRCSFILDFIYLSYRTSNGIKNGEGLLFLVKSVSESISLTISFALQRIQQAEWMEKYRDLLGTDPIWDPEVVPSADADNSEDEVGDVSLESLRELLELGVGLPPHPALEKALAKVQGLLEVSEKIEDKATNFLQAK